MEARSRCSSDPVVPLSFSVHRSNSPTRHFNSPLSSAFSVLLSPTCASFSGASSYSSASTASSSFINFGVDKSTSQVQTARLPISPKSGVAMKKPIPCTPPRKTSKCEEICHDELAGKDRRCRRRMDEKSSHCSHTPLQAPHAKENIFSAAAQQALPYDHGPRCLLKFALGRPRFQFPFWLILPIAL